MNSHTELLTLFGQFFLSKSQLGIGPKVFFLPSKIFFLGPKRWGGGGGKTGTGSMFFPYPLTWDKNKRICVN